MNFLSKIAEKKSVRNIEIIKVQDDERDWVIPVEPRGDSVRHNSYHTTKG